MHARTKSQKPKAKSQKSLTVEELIELNIVKDLKD